MFKSFGLEWSNERSQFKLQANGSLSSGALSNELVSMDQLKQLIKAEFKIASVDSTSNLFSKIETGLVGIGILRAIFEQSVSL